jgi:CubicO group peptidase (beta-lactamase class C family)
MREGLQIGAQVYASLGGEPVADFGIGEARPGAPMTADTLMSWYSSTKAVMPVVIGQLWEAGRLDIDDAASRYLPEFGRNGKERLTFRHLLTHTAGFRNAPPFGSTTAGQLRDNHAEMLEALCNAPIEPGWEPGRRAGYHGGNVHFVLGEVVRRLTGRRYGDYAREAVFGPLQMVDSWIGMPRERYEAYGDRIGIMHLARDGGFQVRPYIESAESARQGHPGGGGRGPMRELARIYELLVLRGEYRGVRLLSPQTVEALTARHRVGLFDESFRVPMDYALGYQVDVASMGRHCSPRAFGHGGNMSSMAFGDPERGVAVGIVCNGMPERRSVHYRRLEEIATAVYEDLGIGSPGDAGRDHPIPPDTDGAG